MKYRKAFTLIELMITVAIIGVLAAIAVMQYQTHVIRSQIVSAVVELNGARPQYELIVNAAYLLEVLFIALAICFFRQLLNIAHIRYIHLCN